LAASTDHRGCALVTGAARRIGRALALEAARAGYDIAIHHRDGARDAESLAREIHQIGRAAAIVHADLAAVHAEDLIGEARAALGPVTLLVNNASIFEDDRIGTMTPQAWDTHMAVNLRAPVFLAQAMANALPRDSHGLVVNILDQRVLRPNPQFFSYALSKAALWDATRTLAQALAPRVRVNGIGPGPTLASIHQSPGDFATEAANVPLARAVAPEEIAAALRYLIDAVSVTGQMIAVDAGQHLSWKTPDIPTP